MISSPNSARLFPVSRRTRTSPTAAVLVLHGGSEESRLPVRSTDPAVLRLLPVAWSISRHLRSTRVFRLQFAIRGWNGQGDDALRDARWALAELRRRSPGLPIVIVGHSMGARVALRLGGDPDVAGVVALTQWSPEADPADQLAGQTVIVIQGAADRTCPVPDTESFLGKAEQAGALIDRTVLPKLEHTMLRRFWVWHRLAWQGVQQVLGSARREQQTPTGN